MEVYRNLAGEILKVEKLQNGRLMAKAEKESKSFENYKQLAVYLYNKGFHIVMTDRHTQFSHECEDTTELEKFVELLQTTELGFRKEVDIYTCWFLGFKPNGMVEVKANTDFSYTNELGYKAVTVDIRDIILVLGDI